MEMELVQAGPPETGKTDPLDGESFLHVAMAFWQLAKVLWSAEYLTYEQLQWFADQYPSGFSLEVGESGSEVRLYYGREA